MTSITISGIVSGLDTSGIIDKLVAVEGNSQTLLTKQQTLQKSVVSAYSSLLSSIGSLTDQVSKLGNTSSWATTSATSSSSSVSATASGSIAGTLSFDVTKTAAAHTLVSAGTVPSTGASVISSGTLTLTKSTGATTNINVGSGSLAEVVAAINGAGAGITATAVQTQPGQYRLQVASSSTGAASQFTLSGNGFTTMNTLTAGQDAEIRIGGASANAYTVTSATNTFNNVAQGINFSVSKVESGVTVSSSVDPKNVSDQITSLVTNVNNLLTSIAQNTAYDSTTKSGGPLVGNSAVRNLQQGVLNIVAGVSAPGLSVTSAGQLSFDAAKFATAFKADPASVAAAFGSSSSFAPAATAPGANVRMTNSTGDTRVGGYDVKVTANAKQEQWQLVQPGTGVVGRLLTLTRGSNSVGYTMQPGEDVATAAANLNTKLAQAGFGASASVDSGGSIILTATNAGSAAAFTASIEGGTAAVRSTPGTDIQGTIDGVAATGIGNILSLPGTSASGAKGLSVAVSASDADITASGGAIGTLSYKPGVARQLESLFSKMSDSSTGELVTAQAQASSQVRTLQTQIDKWTTRLADYRAQLTQKFTAMESSLSALKSQSTALSQFFNTSSSSSSSKS